MAVSASFHRNVLLLSQVILPSDEFKKHFREGMFDKPNTAGFLHISHYLLTIYNSEYFQKLVEWPVICKKTEAKYRNKVKDYLTIISMENPDIGFPNILTSHLIHAGGNKFTIIMWKLSEVVVRKYITRETIYNVMFVPQVGSEKRLEKKFLQEMNAKSSSNISNIHTNLLEMEKMSKTTFEKEQEILTNIRTEIFETEQSIAILTHEAPVHASIKKCLMDVNNADVIQIWLKDINKKLNHMKKKNVMLKAMEQLSYKINNIVLNSNDVNMLDAKEFQKINYLEISELFSYDMQNFLFQLYRNDKLILYNFILLFNSLLTQLHQRLRLNTLEAFSECLLQVEASCKDATAVLNIFQTYLLNITKMFEAQHVLCRKNITQTEDDTMLPIMNDVLLMSSPLIKINTNCSDEESDLQKRLELTPVEAAHKSLFSRYERLKQNHTSKLKENFLVYRINFDDTISTVNNEKQSLHTRSVLPKTKSSSLKHVEKYSQLFSSRIRRNKAVNSSLMSIPRSSKANSTAIANAIEEIHDISELTLNISSKSFCNNSIEFTTPEKLASKQENMSNNTLEMEDVVNALPSKPIMLNICKTIEVEFTNNCDERNVEIQQTKQKRRSIGDLVERYKKILDRSNYTPSSTISNVKYNIE